MKNIMNFYLDDSGTRHPSHNPGKRAAHGYDWFSLGGVLVDDDSEAVARKLYDDFCEKWDVESPLHSSEIRSKKDNFLWLRALPTKKQTAFYEDLYCLMRDAPITGIACVIDRSGYNDRYAKQYNANPWMLCKTAFCVVVERAVKFAHLQGKRIRVLPERCNKPEDNLIRSYYNDLKETGMPFDSKNSGKYAPLKSDEFSAALYELKFKYKTSPLIQLADLYLWPMCMGGYHQSNRPYQRLKNDGKLIEYQLNAEQISVLGTKYSCFEGVKTKE
jgi:uncharacterized protein DUF3800